MQEESAFYAAFFFIGFGVWLLTVPGFVDGIRLVSSKCRNSENAGKLAANFSGKAAGDELNGFFAYMAVTLIVFTTISVVLGALTFAWHSDSRPFGAIMMGIAGMLGVVLFIPTLRGIRRCCQSDGMDNDESKVNTWYAAALPLLMAAIGVITILGLMLNGRIDATDSEALFPFLPINVTYNASYSAPYLVRTTVHAGIVHHLTGNLYTFTFLFTVFYFLATLSTGQLGASSPATGLFWAVATISLIGTGAMFALIRKYAWSSDGAVLTHSNAMIEISWVSILVIGLGFLYYVTVAFILKVGFYMAPALPELDKLGPIYKPTNNMPASRASTGSSESSRLLPKGA